MMTNRAVPGASSDQIRAKANGYFFQLYDPSWVLDKNTTVTLADIHQHLSGEVLDGCLRTLAFYASSLSASHTMNITMRFQHMLRETEAEAITDTTLVNYRSMLTPATEWYLATIRGFLRTWHQLGYPGISKDVIRLLYGWRLKGNRKGDAVKRQDPHEGLLTDNELTAFNEGAVRAYEKSLITIAELAMALSISHTGRRPIQISMLHAVDVLCGENEKGEPFYVLNVPRAKQCNSSFRKNFKPFAISLELWAILSAQARNAISLIENHLRFELQEGDRQQIPLFPDLDVLDVVQSLYEFRQLLATDKLHIPAAKITNTLQYIIEKSDIRSERTGELLHINARRFRYTTGTRAAREGFGELVIAELLDHTDTQNAGVYIKNIPEHVKKLDEAVGFQLAPYAQAFVGVLVDSERGAYRGNDPASRIRTDMGHSVGNCGGYGFCGANVPIPCYTCMHFQPWLDGPHDDVYQGLLNERERVKEITGDIQIAAVLDRSIIAVADVIMRCAKRREELRPQGAIANG
ncbi:TPA: recombinase [Proteus mirabilis]|nr:site-specific integrase [Proteus mirabilis]HBC7456302.1 recombinase [Proteus mirabilis]HCT7981381.1 recombinase [Proteus mirabilis]HDU8702490.1 recombinase [Proteus mirabilis]HEI8493070.1 recombinase [Proteus mirabilis]HEJ0117432.1 recombinase [Proteus mirabilis]